MSQEPNYDNTTIVRMAIVERDDRLVVLMPPDTDPAYVDGFIEAYTAYGWPSDRILVMQGPEAFAVLKGSEDEGQGSGQQSSSDQVDPARSDAESSEAEAQSSDDPQQQI